MCIMYIMYIMCIMCIRGLDGCRNLWVRVVTHTPSRTGGDFSGNFGSGMFRECLMLGLHGQRAHLEPAHLIWGWAGTEDGHIWASWHIWSWHRALECGVFPGQVSEPLGAAVPALPSPRSWLVCPYLFRAELRAPRAAGEQSWGSLRAPSHPFLFPMLRNLSPCPDFPPLVVFGVPWALLRYSREPEWKLGRVRMGLGRNSSP